MNEIFLPTLHTFENGNVFTGSYKILRFRAKPNVTMLNAKEVDMENSSITVQFWHGLYCYEKSEMEGEETFPLSEEGREALRHWLTDHI